MKRFVYLTVVAGLIFALPVFAQESEKKVFRVGIIGLDTSHVSAFTKILNDPAKGYSCRVVAGYPGGSPDVEASASRVEGFTKELREKHGVEIVDSIEAMLPKVDGVLLESVDGRPHLKQAKPVIEAGIPLFIDKPMAGSVADVIEIFELAKEHKVPCWSSSSLRFGPETIGVRNNEAIGDILGCAAYSPCSLEPHHPDLYWYGVHGVEILYTIMGPGCQTVRRIQTDGAEFVVGTWADGRIGTYRGLKAGKKDYGAVVFGSKSVAQAGKYEGYGHLVDEIVKFFQTGKPPVPAEETIELFAFMTAADISKENGGAPVSLPELIEKTRAELKR